MTAAPTVAEVRGHLDRVRARIDELGVEPATIDIVAVTKARAVDVAATAHDAGVADIGENYAQELVAKATSAEMTDRPDARWHMIGRLQRNKVKMLAPHVALWQAVDRRPLGAEIAKRAPGARVLVQVNISGESQKGGCPPDETGELVDGLRELGLGVEGLMGVASAGGGDRARAEFASLRSLVDTLGLQTCSMGMSDDFPQAVAEGATMLRLGTVLVGPRPDR